VSAGNSSSAGSSRAGACEGRSRAGVTARAQQPCVCHSLSTKRSARERLHVRAPRPFCTHATLVHVCPAPPLHTCHTFLVHHGQVHASQAPGLTPPTPSQPHAAICLPPLPLPWLLAHWARASKQEGSAGRAACCIPAASESVYKAAIPHASSKSEKKVPASPESTSKAATLHAATGSKNKVPTASESACRGTAPHATAARHQYRAPGHCCAPGQKGC